MLRHPMHRELQILGAVSAHTPQGFLLVREIGRKKKRGFFLCWDISRLAREHPRQDKTRRIILAPRNNRPWRWQGPLATTTTCPYHPEYPSWPNVCPSALAVLSKSNIRGRCLKGKWEAPGALAAARGDGKDRKGC